MALLLGKQDPVRLETVKFLPDYVTEALPTAPDSSGGPAIGDYNWGMFCNDRLGCCVMSGAAHLDMAWNTEVQEHDSIPSDWELQHEYFHLTGGQDTGLAETSALQHWVNTGLFGYKINAWAPVDHTNPEQIKQAIAFYGAAYFGVQLPQSAQQQFAPGSPSTWSVVPGSPIEGGHCIVGTSYDPDVCKVITWGQAVSATWEWIAQYLDEAYVIIPDQFVEAGHGPALDLAALRSDLASA